MRRPGPLAAALPAGLLLLTACGGITFDGADPAETSPPSSPNQIKQIEQPASIGLDIRHLDESGQIKTLPVKDFQR